MYVPPTSSDSYQLSLMSYLTELLSLSENVILVGDFNLPDINWSTMTGASLFQTFSDFVFDSNLMQLVEDPTHIKGNTLSLLVTTANNVCDLFEDTSNYSITSDHYIVTFKIEFSMHLQNTHQALHIFDYKHADMDNLFAYMLDYDFTDCLQSNNIGFSSRQVFTLP